MAPREGKPPDDSPPEQEGGVQQTSNAECHGTDASASDPDPPPYEQPGDESDPHPSDRKRDALRQELVELLIDSRGELFKQVRGMVSGFQFAAAPEVVNEIAGEIVQRVVYRALRDLPNFDPTHVMSIWILRIANSELGKLRRERQNQRFHEISADRLNAYGSDPYTDGLSLIDLLEAHHSGNMRSEAEAAEADARFERLLELLTAAEDRQFLTLYYERGFTPADIAAEMNIASVGAVYQRKFRILGRLERALIEAGHGKYP